MKVEPEEIGLDTSTHCYSLYKLDAVKRHEENPRDPRKYFEQAFFKTVGYNPLLGLKTWITSKGKKLAGQVTDKLSSDQDDSEVTADFSRLFDLQKGVPIVGKKALEMDLFSAFPEYSERAAMHEYNIAFKRKAYTFDARRFSEKILQEL